jgi:large subunit ribosomal protein L21
MFAVIKTGGKQYRVAAKDTITVMSLEGGPGDAVTFGEVLMLSSEAGTQVGAPFVAGASVAGQIVEQTRGEKVIAFKKRRRKNSKRKRGHRQDLTLVEIVEILADGAGRSAAAEAVPTEAAPVEAVAAETVPEAAPAEPLAPAELVPAEATEHAEA